jgi:hypothetical protein
MTFKSRYKGPVTSRNFEELDSEVEREAFLMEARLAAESIARQMGKKFSLMRYVASELFSIAESGLQNRS